MKNANTTIAGNGQRKTRNETGAAKQVTPCFTPGTMIATAHGEVAVEDLKVGDGIVTRDNGIQEIRWLGKRNFNRHDFNAAPHLQPILIRAGALGNGLPERDMRVSPNHRVLVAADQTQLYFEDREVLVAAKHLVNNRGVFSMESLSATYIHFLFDKHEVVLSDGSWTESFQPEQRTLRGLGNAQRQEIFEVFPDLQKKNAEGVYSTARRVLSRQEALHLRQK